MTAKASKLTSTCQTSISNCLQESSEGTDNSKKANTGLGSSASELRCRGLGAGGVAASGGSLSRRDGSSGVLAGVRGVGGNDRGGGGAVDGGNRLGGDNLRGLRRLDSDNSGVGRDAEDRGLSDSVCLLLVSSKCLFSYAFSSCGLQTRTYTMVGVGQT